MQGIDIFVPITVTSVKADKKPKEEPENPGVLNCSTSISIKLLQVIQVVLDLKNNVALVVVITTSNLKLVRKHFTNPLRHYLTQDGSKTVNIPYAVFLYFTSCIVIVLFSDTAITAVTKVVDTHPGKDLHLHT